MHPCLTALILVNLVQGMPGDAARPTDPASVERPAQSAASSAPPVIASGEPRTTGLWVARDVIVDHRRRTIMVFATPSKHRRVVAALQRILADAPDKPTPAAALPSAVPKVKKGTPTTYVFKGERVVNVIRTLAMEQKMNLLFKGPQPGESVDLEFHDVQGRELLKLILDLYNCEYQMNASGETLVVQFGDRINRAFEAYAVPARISTPLEDIALAIQNVILATDEPAGPGPTQFEGTGGGGGEGGAGAGTGAGGPTMTGTGAGGAPGGAGAGPGSAPGTGDGNASGTGDGKNAAASRSAGGTPAGVPGGAGPQGTGAGDKPRESKEIDGSGDGNARPRNAGTSGTGIKTPATGSTGGTGDSSGSNTPDAPSR